MELHNLLPFWEKLNQIQKESLTKGSRVLFVHKDDIVFGGMEDCLGLILVKRGTRRIYSI